MCDRYLLCSFLKHQTRLLHLLAQARYLLVPLQYQYLLCDDEYCMLFMPATLRIIQLPITPLFYTSAASLPQISLLPETLQIAH